jgi:hypothetical protein
MEVRYIDKELTPQERIRTIAEIDKLVQQYAESIPVYHQAKVDARTGNVPIKPLAKLLEIINSAGEFTIMVIADCAVAQKFFLTSINDYDKRFARGKLRVILNEGFKKIYGFNSEKKRSKKSATIWEQISVLLPLFPENLKIEHDEIQASLEKYSKDMWWMNERNIETHLDVDALYESRREEIIESKVIMESMELVNILLRVHDFITKLHGSYCETLVQQYLRQQVESSKI